MSQKVNIIFLTSPRWCGLFWIWDKFRRNLEKKLGKTIWEISGLSLLSKCPLFVTFLIRRLPLRIFRKETTGVCRQWQKIVNCLTCLWLELFCYFLRLMTFPVVSFTKIWDWVVEANTLLACMSPRVQLKLKLNKKNK